LQSLLDTWTALRTPPATSPVSEQLSSATGDEFFHLIDQVIAEASK